MEGEDYVFTVVSDDISGRKERKEMQAYSSVTLSL